MTREDVTWRELLAGAVVALCIFLLAALLPGCATVGNAASGVADIIDWIIPGGGPDEEAVEPRPEGKPVRSPQPPSTVPPPDGGN